MRKYLPLAALILIVSGCGGMDESKKNAMVAVDDFHASYDAGDYERIYEAAADEYKQVTSLENHKRLMTTVEKRLGTFSGKTLQNWNVNYGTNGNIVNLVYQSKYSEAAATEVFMVKETESGPKIVGYNISSPALMVELEEIEE